MTGSLGSPISIALRGPLASIPRLTVSFEWRYGSYARAAEQPGEETARSWWLRGVGRLAVHAGLLESQKVRLVEASLLCAGSLVAGAALLAGVEGLSYGLAPETRIVSTECHAVSLHLIASGTLA